ncbi:MAG: GLPGLI family protein, partial [Prevotella sp.]|nr:GLPGLI family protein [Prevotella sp.]
DIMAEMIAAKVHQVCIDTANLVVAYDYECQTQDADGKAVTDRMKLCLLVGRHCTRSFPYRKFRKEREWAEGKKQSAADFLQMNKREYMEGYDFFSDELPLLRAESFCFMPQVWTDYPEGQVTVRDAIPPSIYETQEKRKTIKWTLSDERLRVGEQGSGITLTVGGYLCKTAVCQLHGLKWTVRYAEDIPTTAGPWKLCGLPGLIVEAVSDDGIHRFTLTELQHATAPIFYETNAITVKTSEEKLIKNRNKTFGNRLYPKNPHYYITDLHAADTAYDNEGMLINGTYVNDKAHVYQPLECK